MPFLPRAASRLGLGRIAFAPYKKAEVEEIVLERLSRAGGGGVFSREAVAMVAAKVAQISGDARRALQIGQRAIEVVR